MAFGVAFGRYLPGDTFVHRLDARVKVLMAFGCAFALLASRTWVAIAVMAGFATSAYGVARIPVRVAWRGVKPLLWILVFTVLANTLTFHTQSVEGALALVGSLGVKPDGFLAGLYHSTRIALLVLACSIITFTASNIELADALTSLMGPLRHLHAPVDDIAMMLSIALRFIPLTSEEAQAVVSAQRARGVRFNEGTLMQRARKWSSVLVPLFVGLFRRADSLAAAMDARCYTGTGRTAARTHRLRQTDWATLVIALSACLAIGVLL